MRKAAFIPGSWFGWLALAVALGTADSARAEVPLVQFETVEASFAPEIKCQDGLPPVLLWAWSDGSGSTNYPEAAVEFDSAGLRTQSLTVEPAEALVAINLGFDGQDGGWFQAFNQREPQGVSGVTFAGPLTNFQLFAASYNPLTNTLDFTGFDGLLDVECFHCTNLQHAVVHDLPSVQRLCFEDCDLQELDISTDPVLEDLRAALNNYTNVILGGGTGPRIWHFCTRDNPQLTQQFESSLTNSYALQVLYVWNDNQSGSLASFVSTNLTDVKAYSNHYAFADFSGQRHLTNCLISDNSLTNLVLSNCVGLIALDAHNNQFTRAVLDRLLAFLDSSAPQLASLDLSGNAELPSTTGLAHLAKLTRRGVVAQVDQFDPHRTISVTVQPGPAGRSFTVDGRTYTNAQVFRWVAGTSHRLATTSPQGPSTGAQYLWSGWNDGGAMSHSVMPLRDASYTVGFVPNPFLTTKGTYQGLFQPAGAATMQNSGFVQATVTDRGAFSARLQLAGRSYSLSGQFSLNGTASNYLAQARPNPLRLTLSLNFERGDALDGQLSDGNWLAGLTANRPVFDAVTNAVPAGKYTLIIPGDDGSRDAPGGESIGTFTVDQTGRLQLTATLAEGSRFTQSTSVSSQGHVPLYASLYGGLGGVRGWMSFTNREGDDLNGMLAWTKPAQAASKYYQGGFNLQTEAIGGKYLPPPPATRALNLTSGEVWFANGNLPQSFTNQILLGTDNNVKRTNDNKLLLTLTPASGLFRGTATAPGTARVLNANGALLQKRNAGYGFFLGTNQAGRVFLGE